MPFIFYILYIILYFIIYDILCYILYPSDNDEDNDVDMNELLAGIEALPSSYYEQFYGTNWNLGFDSDDTAEGGTALYENLSDADVAALDERSRKVLESRRQIASLLAEIEREYQPSKTSKISNSTNNAADKSA